MHALLAVSKSNILSDLHSKLYTRISHFEFGQFSMSIKQIENCVLMGYDHIVLSTGASRFQLPENHKQPFFNDVRQSYANEERITHRCR